MYAIGHEAGSYKLQTIQPNKNQTWVGMGNNKNKKHYCEIVGRMEVFMCQAPTSI